MRRSWSTSTLMAVALASALAISPSTTPSATAASSGGHVVSVAVDAGPFVVDGMTGSATAAITVVATDTGGAIGVCNGAEFEPAWLHEIELVLTRTAGGPADQAVVHLRTQAAAGDGEHWTGSWRIGSTRGGTWAVSSLWWCQGDTSFSGTPPSPATLEVVGTHAPTVTYTRVPLIASFGARQWMVATYRDGHGRPLVSYPIVYGEDTTCGFDGDGDRQLATDSRGRVAVRLYRNLWQCLYFAYPGRLPWAPAMTLLQKDDISRYSYFAAVTITSSARAVRVGHAVAVTATVVPAFRQPVRLQRLVGRTWRTIATATLRASGHASFAFAPSGLGTTYLRVVALPDAWTTASYAPTPSRPLALLGTPR